MHIFLTSTVIIFLMLLVSVGFVPLGIATVEFIDRQDNIFISISVVILDILLFSVLFALLVTIIHTYIQ